MYDFLCAHHTLSAQLGGGALASVTRGFAGRVHAQAERAAACKDRSAG